MRPLLVYIILCRTLLGVAVVVATPMNPNKHEGSYLGNTLQQPERNVWHYEDGQAGKAAQGTIGSLSSSASKQPAVVPLGDSVPLRQGPARQATQASTLLHHVPLSPLASWDELAPIAKLPSEEELWAALWKDNEEVAQETPEWAPHLPSPEAQAPAESSVAGAVHSPGSPASLVSNEFQHARTEQRDPEESFFDHYAISWIHTPGYEDYPKIEPKRLQSLTIHKPIGPEPPTKAIVLGKNERIRAQINKEVFDDELTWANAEIGSQLKRLIRHRSPFDAQNRLLSGKILQPQGAGREQIYIVDHRRSRGSFAQSINIVNKPYYSFWGRPQHRNTAPGTIFFYGFGYVDLDKIKKHYSDTPRKLIDWKRVVSTLERG